MNFSVYLFGQLGGSYTQYPDDYTSKIFAAFESNIKSQIQLMIHRDNDLMFYAYVYRLSEQSKYIGVCIVLNGVSFSDVKPLCQLCEDAINTLVISGDILEFADNGDIVSKVAKLYKTSTEFKRLSESLTLRIESANIPFVKLPPINYAINSNLSKTFTFDHGQNAINEALKEYCNIYVYSDSKSETLNSFSDKLRRLNNENTELKTQNATILRQKKRTTIVTILALLIFIAIVAVLSLASSSNMKAKKINELEATNNDLNEQIGVLILDTAKLHTDIHYFMKLSDFFKQESERYRQDNDQLRKDSISLQEEIYDLQNLLTDKIIELASCRNLIKDYKNKSVKSNGSNQSGSSAYQSNNNYNNSYSKAYTIGSLRKVDYYGGRRCTLWLQTFRAITINTLYVMPDKSGEIDLQLYNADGTLHSSKRIYLSANQWNKINVGFPIMSPSRYFLTYSSNNNISLGSRNIWFTDYKKFENEHLKILGVGYVNNFVDIYQTSYVYFYEISYSLL